MNSCVLGASSGLKSRPEIYSPNSVVRNSTFVLISTNTGFSSVNLSIIQALMCGWELYSFTLLPGICSMPKSLAESQL